MDWFLTKIIFRICSGEGEHQPQFDEQLRLVQAQNRPEAFQKAVALGQQEQEQFKNQQGQWVYWQFVNVTEVTKLNGLEDGTEIHYQIIEPEDARHYIDCAHRRAQAIATVTGLSQLKGIGWAANTSEV
jgi:hypothetical protein